MLSEPLNAADPQASGAAPANTTVGRRITAGTVWGGVLVATTIVTSIIHYKQVIGLLPREVAGLWLLFWSFGSYLAFFDLGVGPTLSREVSFLAHDPDRHPRIADLVVTCLRIYLTVCGVLLGVALGLGYLLLPTLKLTAVSLTDAFLAWALFAGGACVNLLGNVSFAVLTGEGHVATERLTRAVSMAVWLCLSAFALTSGYGLTGLAIAWLVNACLGRLLAVLAVTLSIKGLRLRAGVWRGDLARRLASPSARWALTQLGALLILQTSNVLIAWSLGPSAIPSFEAASRVIMAVGTLALLGTNASVPFYSRAFAANDLPALRHLLFRNVQQGFITMAAAVGVLVFFAPDLFKTWLGHGNFAGYAVIMTMAVMMTLEVHHVAHASLVMASGHIPFVRMALIAGVLNLLLSYVLVQSLGLWGAALGTMLAQICTNNWFAPHISLRRLGIGTLSYLGTMLPRLALLLLAFVGVEAVVSMATQSMSAIVRLVAGVGAAGVLYFALLRFLPVPAASTAPASR